MGINREHFRKKRVLIPIEQSGILNLQTYSRPELLEKCLESISNCHDSAELLKLIVLQTGNRDVENLVRFFESKNRNTLVIEVDGRGKSPLQNMNWNRWVAWERGFDKMFAPWILSIEEDIILHPKSVQFVRNIFEMISNDPKFRGVNLGSKLTDERLNCSYSKLRFGLHGCGAAISARTWREIKRLGIKRKINDFPLDACIEHILKDGFMVTPNLSHYLDFGWYQGTHTDSNPNHPHYLQVRKSYEANTFTCSAFRHEETNHDWREDCVTYLIQDNFKFKTRKYLSLIIATKFWLRTYTHLRKIKRFVFKQAQL